MTHSHPITSGDALAPRALSNSSVYLLNNEQLDHYWPRIEAELEAQPELWNKWFTIEALFEMAMAGNIQVWVVSNSEEKITAVFMSQILCVPAGKVLQVFWMRGTLPDGALKRISLTLDHFGNHHKCFLLSVVGRKGWERRLRDLGASLESVILSRPILYMTRN